jgi:hypothetical protein
MPFQVSRILSLVCRQILQVFLKVLVSMLIFAVCLTATLRYLGIPLPGIQELLHSFDGVSELARILS